MLLFFSFRNYGLNYFYCINNGAAQFFFGNGSNAKKTMEVLISDYSQDDIVLVNHASYAEFYYYSKYFDFNPQTIIFTDDDSYTQEEYMAFIEKIINLNRTCKFYCSTDYSSDKKILLVLKNLKNIYPNVVEYKVGKSYVIYVKK